MTSRVTEQLRRLGSMREALPEIESASYKINVYDRYYSQGGSPSDSGDYFEIQRILEDGVDISTTLPPRTSLRTDLELMAELTVFYAMKIGRYRIAIDELQGFILPKNLSPGESEEIVAAGNNNSQRLLLIGAQFVLIGLLKEKIHKQIIGSPQEKISQWLISTGSENVQKNPPLSTTERIRERLKNVEQVTNEDETTFETINSLRDLQSSVRGLMNQNCPVESIASESDINKVIEILKN